MHGSHEHDGLPANWGDETWQRLGLPVPGVDWHESRSFQIGGIGVRLRSSVALTQFRFKPQLVTFSVDDAGADSVYFSHVFEMPERDAIDFGEVVFQRDPWILSKRDGAWFYRCIAPHADAPFCLAVFSDDYTQALVYHPPTTIDWLRDGDWTSLALLPTDQIWLCQLVADRMGVLLHAAAVILDGVGFVFAGKSGAGKSTIVELLRKSGLFHQVEVLCDDRVIVRRYDDHWRVFGTWSHGSVPEVSSQSAALGGVCLLEQATENALQRVHAPAEALHALLAVLIRPLTTHAWWEKELGVLERLVRDTHLFRMQFDLSGDIAEKLLPFTQ